MSERTESIAPHLQILACSFLALFLELMLIRWVPSGIRLVSYFSNLLLISSFLGLGLGAMAARRGFGLYARLPQCLLASIGLIYLSRSVTLSVDNGELRFFSEAPTLLNYVVLVAVFAVNVILFMPLGERIGQLFDRMPPLRAYSWDLGGSLAGTLSFGLFAYVAFSPLTGMLVVVAIYFLIAPAARTAANIVCVILALLTLQFTLDPNAIWSPYYYVTVHEAGRDESFDIDAAPADVRTMQDPLAYTVHVNHHFYQPHETIDPTRFSADSRAREFARQRLTLYSIPYMYKPAPHRVAVVGAGGGVDVEAALLNDAGAVDAVEIDPTLIAIADRIGANGVYDDPRVSIRIDDARAFLQRTDQRYDVIVFGYLDSQTLFSSFSSVRLDGYVYTVESLRNAWQKLDDDGLLSLSFALFGQDWLAFKLIDTVERATGRRPLIYLDNGSIVLVATRQAVDNPLARIGTSVLVDSLHPPGSVLPTDDWPYLYLSERTVPFDYLVVIASLLLISVLGVATLKSGRSHLGDFHFFLLGLGFLLLQTSSITSCTLYFGTTWLVTTVIVAGVLLMVLLANQVAIRFLDGFSPWLYLPLLASVLVLYLTPNAFVLGLPLGGRVAWALLIMPLPIFFAGLVFSTTFRDSPSPSASFGANLIGATTGGFIEYGGMLVGHRALTLLVLAAYLASYLVLGASRRNTAISVAGD